jgi:hypothetical protein
VGFCGIYKHFLALGDFYPQALPTHTLPARNANRLSANTKNPPNPGSIMETRQQVGRVFLLLLQPV